MRAVIFGIVCAASVAQAQPPADQPGPSDGPPPDMPIAPQDPPSAPPQTPAPAPSPAEVEATPAPVEPAPSPAPAAAPAPTPETVIAPSTNKDTAWLFVGGALTFVTVGAVLAYSTSSAEQDLRDLYTTTSGTPPAFDADTQQRYEALTREGRRYEVLAWTSFGLATACAAGAAIFFVKASHESVVNVTPAVSPTSAGVSLRLSFD